MSNLRIENWWYGVSEEEMRWQAPECIRPTLRGNVFGHSRHEDGEYVSTSRPVGWDNEEQSVITYSGSRYTLGEVDPEYLKEYPDAKERLINALKGESIESSH